MKLVNWGAWQQTGLKTEALLNGDKAKILMRYATTWLQKRQESSIKLKEQYLTTKEIIPSLTKENLRTQTCK